MKKNYFTLLLLFLSMAAQAATEKLRIMSFNIPYKNVVTESNTWPIIAEHLADYVGTVSPDLMGWQEPVRDELTDLLSRMPGYAMVGWARDDGKEKGEYTPILYKTERFYVEAYGNYWLTDTPDKVSRIEGVAHNRIATWALMQDKQTGARFIYTNTHLSYESPETKFIQIGYLKTYMKEVQDRYGSSLPHFLTGDFNMTRVEGEPRGNNYNYVLNYKLILKDMWTNARKQINTGNNSNDGGIDYIYASKSVSCTQAEWGNRVTADGCTMSDHNPIWADVQWTTSNEDNARAAIREARELIDSTYTYTQKSNRLFTVATLTSDGMEGSHMLTYAMDGNTSTYCQSLANLPPNQPHYIQGKLSRAATSFRFQYVRRSDSAGLSERWEDVLITASEDGTEWDYVTELYGFGGTSTRAYTSPDIPLHKDSYKYLRFSIMRTPGMTLRNGAPQFSCAEFAVMQNVPDEESERYVEQNVSAAVDQLEVAIATLQGYIDEGKVTSTKVKEFRTAIGALRDARENPTALTAVQPSHKAELIHSISGQRLSRPQKGLNIITDRNGTRKVLR